MDAFLGKKGSCLGVDFKQLEIFLAQFTDEANLRHCIKGLPELKGYLPKPRPKDLCGRFMPSFALCVTLN